MAVSTKDQERKALEKIRKIIEDLGEDSYVGTALDGCLEIAEDNIGNDFADSMKARLERAQDSAAYYKDAANYNLKQEQEKEEEVRRLEAEKAELQKELDAELEWHDCAGGTNMKQSDYEELYKASGPALTEEQAKEKLHWEFGFDPEQIKVYGSDAEVCTYEADRHHRMRPKEKYRRWPLYESSDWNYIRFDCAGWQYEMIDGELYKYES